MTQTTTCDANLKIVSGLGDAKPTKRTSQGLDVLQLDSRTYDRSLSCVHCGLCLPACPTYTENGKEADSPRGRIHLMKGMADGLIKPTDEVVKHLDLCLDCQACETACPSGVVYHELIEETRAKLAPTRKKSFLDRMIQGVFYHVFPYPTRLKLALLPVRILQKVGLWKAIAGSTTKFLPPQLQKMVQMLPPTGALWESNLATSYSPTKASEKKTKVALFPGCVGSVMFQDVNRKTIDLLTHLGCDVVVPKAATCCGAIHHHGGDDEGARQFARANIDAFLKPGEEPDMIVNNIAGCGAGLKDFDHLLRDDPAYAERAKVFVSKVYDVCELLEKLDPPAPTHAVKKTVTYHHACHLVHAQRAGDPPLRLLKQVASLKVIELVEADMCCGAAGTYNLTQPQMAMALAERKIRHIEQTGATLCVMANVGCAMQIQSEADRLGVNLSILHPVEVLHEAYFGAHA